MLAARRPLLLTVAVLAVLLSIGITVENHVKRNTINVLFIGNSYTFVNSMPSILEQLSADAVYLQKAARVAASRERSSAKLNKEAGRVHSRPTFL